ASLRRHGGSGARLGFRPALDDGSDRRSDRSAVDGRSGRAVAFLRAGLSLARRSCAGNLGSFDHGASPASSRGVAAAESSTAQVLPRVFWIYVAAAGLLAFGTMDFPLLPYHFQSARVTTAIQIPLLYSGAMAVNGMTALLFGRMFDRYDLTALA